MAKQKRTIGPNDPTEFDQYFAEAEAANNLPPGLIKALAYQESRFNPNAHNEKSGAHGITQWMSKSAEGWNVDRYDPKSSIDGTGRYLRSLIDRFGGRVDLALAAYNGGEGNIERWLKDGTWITNDEHIRPKENIEYPEKIFGHMGIKYTSSSSPMLGKNYTRFAQGKNATPIMPDGSTLTSSNSSNLDLTDYFLQSQKPNLSGTYQFKDIDPSLIPQTMQEQPEIDPETATTSTFYNPLDFNNTNRFSLAYQPQAQQQAFSFVPESPLFQGAETAQPGTNMTARFKPNALTLF